ncbi:TetR/AcrR family transcriptional regulator [Paenibacillus sp. WLX1005]|uniref:TetR/AcrR family transcriptional regulator n=1 Tax=Paenibacillus sp. WLX1005 TaxID=3243766 RepID=UPI003983FEF6
MPAPGRPREFKDQRVVEAAVDAFLQKGYAACSAQDLCEQTGLGRGSLYNAFGNKHELYIEALEHYDLQGLSEQKQILQRPISVKARLQALLDFPMAFDFAEQQKPGCLVINAAMERGGMDADVDRIFQRHVGLLEDMIIAVLHEALDSGELQLADSESLDTQVAELAAMLLSSFYGLRVLNKGTQNRELAHRIANGTLTAIFGV